MGLFIDDEVLEEQGGIKPLHVIHEMEIEKGLGYLLLNYEQLFQTDSVKNYIRRTSPRVTLQEYDPERSFLKHIQTHKENIRRAAGYLELAGYHTGDETLLRRVSIVIRAFEDCRHCVYEANHKANTERLK
jgi:hypothetical protein